MKYLRINHFNLRYKLSAGTNNTRNHFTAVIKTDMGGFVHFNDLNSTGCLPLQQRIHVDFVLYQLDVGSDI